MATTPVRRAAAAPTKAAAAPIPAAEAETKGISRREFLYYIWGASLALLTAESTGTIIWFSLPRFRAGEFGGVFTIDASTLPQVGSSPVGFPAGKFWLSNQKDGFRALSMVCTHLGCLFKWVEVNHRFECPCHGSKFEANGTKIKGLGPAPRNLDRFEVVASKPGGATEKTSATGGPVNVSGATAVAINTGKKIKGWPEGSPPQV
jgi:cytochrome b6-f complex iron-sulfur subunit